MRTLLTVFVALLLITPVTAQTHGRGDSRPSGPSNGGVQSGSRLVPNGHVQTTLRPIVNRVVDLLDDDVQLSTDNVTVWESEPIDTSQFNQIGIRVSGEASPFVACRTEWQFSAEDEFLSGGPHAFLGTNVLRGDFGRLEYDTDTPRDRQDYLGDDPSLRQDYIFFTGIGFAPLNNFGEVAGMIAKIVCSIPVPTVTIGDDPDIGTGGETGSTSGDGTRPDTLLERSATLSDVKVLLRRL